jgi:PAS domain S-box-containing protein
MKKKPTYEELEQGVEEVEKESFERKQAEEALRESEEKYRSILESIEDGYYEVDIAGNFTFFNDSMCRILGYSKDELMGMNNRQYMDEENAKKVFQAYNSVYRTKKSYKAFGWELIRKDGSRCYVETSVSLRSDSGGKPIGFQGIARDITERKRAEEERDMLQAQLSNALEMAHLGHWEYDVANDLFTFNDHFYKIFRTTAMEVGGYTISSAEYARRFVHPDDIPVVAEEIRKAIEAPDANFRRQLEHRMIYADGTIGYISVQFFIVKDAQGRTVKTYGVNQDITERKRIEEALREGEEHYRSIFEDSRDAVYITTRDGKFIDANQSALDLFGYSREEMASVNALQLYADPGDAGRFQKEIEKKGFLRDYEVTFRKKDGTEIDCLLNTTIRRANDGSILAYQGIIRDMTEQKKLEAQLRQSQKMEAIGTMAGGIAHDFNNILGIIIGNTELALGDVPERNPAKGCLEEIRSASLRAKDVVRHILSFSRKSVSERKPIQITSIIKDSLKLLRASIPTTIEIRQDFSCEHDTVLADPIQVNQVLMNLCTNASHAMREEGGVLEVGLKNVDLELGNKALDLEPGRYVKLSVSDTGPGIDSTTIDRIFDPYFTTKGLGEGTGMGLSVVHGIVKNYDGAVMVKSEPGKGAVFEVFFPLTEAEAEPEDKEAGALPTGDEKILFVDDEESLVRMVRRMLEMHGYQVETRSDPVEALELFRSKPDRFDLIITDMTMPNMTGDRLANEILRIRPDMPIILCSGFSDKIDAEKAKELGVRKYIEKPLNMSDFVVAVRKVLDEQKR